MPSPPRILLPGTMAFITSRTEEGLPFIGTPLMRLVLESIMARAQAVYPVRLCHYLWMGNHFHFVIYVEDPSRVEAFIGRVKTESAHAINRFLGRRRRTVWVADYDSVPILTLEDGARKISYLYCNPVKANVCSSVQNYGRPSSWEAFRSGDYKRIVPWINRSDITPGLLENPSACQVLYDNVTNSHGLQLEPDAWMDSFGVHDPIARQKVNEKIVQQVLFNESELRKTRTRPVYESARIDQPYVPTTFARRMWCICSDVTLRARFINFIKELIKKGREVLRKWRAGDRSVPYPHGICPPSFPRLASLTRFEGRTLAQLR